jgi:RNA polymerase sigma-70 factor (ECF subfamily)
MAAGAMVQVEGPDTRDDVQLVARVAQGDERALRVLYRRHAPLVFAAAARLVRPATADDVVQEVFVTLWQKASTFDPQRGTLPAWLAHIARRRAQNELRRDRDKARGGEAIENVADPRADEDAETRQWADHRRDAVRAAVDALPDAERRALSLAFLDELTHEQVAATLGTPLGTAKTRIRSARKRLALMLAAVIVALVVLAARREARIEARRERDERALRMVTASDVTPLRLEPAAGLPPEAHGTYRAHASSSVAVLTASHLPPPPPGARYEGWVRVGEKWIAFGEMDIGADGRAVAVAEDPALAGSPDEARVTLETAPETGAPRGAAVLAWRAVP